jgi:outer membrane protein assembly factor BamB
MKNMATLVTILISLSYGSVFAAEWPGLYGPQRNHGSAQKGLLRTWPQEGPKVLWTLPMAVGFGGPAVAGGKVYVAFQVAK